MRRLLLDGNGLPVLVELDHAITLRIVHVIAEHARTFTGLGLRHGLAQGRAQAVAVEDVVAQHQRARFARDELLAQEERLCQPVRAGLHLVGKAHAVMRAVTQEPLEVRQVLRRADNQDVADAGHHQHAERVVDHRLVVYGQQLLRRDRGQRVQSRARATSKNNALHYERFPSLRFIKT